MNWTASRRIVFFTSIAFYAVLGPLSAAAQQTGGDVSASVPEAGAHALVGALAGTTVEPSSGVMRAALPISVPRARGASQPSLALTYSSAAGVREAGVGWGIPLPTIQRSTRQGPPSLEDYFEKPPKPFSTAPEPAEPDEFLFNGARLVPICEVGAAKQPCNVLGAEPFPSWALTAGTRYYRLEIDTQARFFWSAGRSAWRVQLPGGEILELGRPDSWDLIDPTIKTDPDASIDYDEIRKLATKPNARETVITKRAPFRWNLVRRYQPSPSGEAPNNVVFYRWAKLGSTGLGYLTDVYYSPPASIVTERSRGIAAASFAHHVHLEWNFIAQADNRYTPTWRATPDYTLARIDVASKRYGKAAAPRELVRRYHLTYKGNQRAYLQAFQMEGRCASPIEEVNGQLPTTSACKRLPATIFAWSEPELNKIPSVLTADPGFPFEPPANWRLVPLDIDADGLPDLVETNPSFEPNEGEGDDAFGLLANTTRRVYVRNDIFFEERALTGPAALFSRFGYSVTGDYDATARTGAVVFAPRVRSVGCAPEGPCEGKEVILSSNTFLVERTGNTSGGLAFSWQTAPGSGSISIDSAGTFQVEEIGDINGDGVPDILDAHADDKDASEIRVRYGLRRPDTSNGVKNYGVAQSTFSCVGPSRDMMSRSNWAGSTPTPALADMNGDGLADLVIVGPSNIEYWPGDGRGHFSACRGAGCTCSEKGVEALSVHMLPPPSFGVGSSATGWHVADVNGDGYADLIVVGKAGVEVYMNIEGFAFSAPTLVSFFDLVPQELWAPLFNHPEMLNVSFADMNGNGITDLVLQVGRHVLMWDLHRLSVMRPFPFTGASDAPRPGLLVGIDNGLGAKTEIVYTTTAELARNARAVGKPWTEAIPQVMQVVARLTTSTSVPGDVPVRVAYTYDDPSWDGYERTFRGFRVVTATRLGVPALHTRTTFFIPACPARECWSRAPDFHMQLAASGLPIVSEIFDDQGRYLSTVSSSYHVISPMAAFDGTPIRFAYPTRVDTRLYDTNDWVASEGTSTVQISFGDGAAIWTGPSPVRSRANVLLRSTQRKDTRGNTFQVIDFGRINDDGSSIDDPILKQTAWFGMRPDWKSLPKSTSVLPFAARPGVSDDHERLRKYFYDAAGRLTEVEGFLEGTLPLDRRHESAQPVAPAPPTASGNNKWLTLVRYSYDAFDNMVERRAANNRCQGVTYDDEFAQLAAKTSAYRSGCGLGSINATHRWDRGLELMTDGTEHGGAVTRMSYDGFGRPLLSWLPTPATGQTAAQPSAAYTYFDIPGGPAQRSRLEVNDGNGRTRVMWSYVDGFGRPLLTLMKADPAAGDNGAWVARGPPRLGVGKVISGTYAPWFYNGNPAKHPLALPSPTPALTAVDLDTFSRVVDLRRPDGTIARHSIFRPLSEESVDAIGRRTMLKLDGHGRAVTRLAWGAGNDQIAVETTYQVAGETARIVRSHSLNADSIVRWMRYDSLGRMVQNAEPNTSTSFDADPALATAMHSWRYAYNDVGELVGTSDARGCGENLAYDDLGRLLAEDYSPCLTAHASYSPYQAATGAGAEVLYRYDAPEPGQTTGFGVEAINLVGRLVSVMDRASHLRFAYDFRGQQVGITRRLTQPSTAGAAWPEGFPSAGDRYTGQWFTSSTQYDLFGHVVQFSTGATSPEMTGFEGLSEINLAYSDRGLPTSIGGSYGLLIESTEFAADGRPMSVRYADAAHTESLFGYDANRRTQRHEVSRRPPPLWTTGAPGYDPPLMNTATSGQLRLARFIYHYDAVGLLQRIEDQRLASEWPPGALPVNTAFQYDRLSRLTRADYQRSAPDASAAFAPLDNAIPPATLADRAAFQTYGFDFTGNITQSDDDVSARYDRSLGEVLHGSLSQGPNQLRSAANTAISAVHDAAGQLIDLVVTRAGPCAAANGKCTHRLVYDRDEVGFLSRARRWDYDVMPVGEAVHPALPATMPAADLRYRYGADGDRVITSSVAADGLQHHTVDVFETLRLKQAAFDTAARTYDRSAASEVVRIPGVGRVVHHAGLPRLNGSDRHLLLEFSDHLGSSIITIDHATGELAERSTYQAFGGAESDYHPARWSGIASEAGFSGHPLDAEVGLVYFGARYYQPSLQRWISADPVTIHGLGSDLNPYAYVGGQPSMGVDAHGLQSMCSGACEQALVQGFQIQVNQPSFVTGPITVEGMAPGTSTPKGMNGSPQWHGAMNLMVNFVPLVESFALVADPARTLNTVVQSRLEVFESLLGEPNTTSDSSQASAREAGSAGQRAMSDSDQLTSIAEQQVLGAAAGKVAGIALTAALRAPARVVIREGAVELSGSEFTLFSDQFATNAARVPAESDGYWNVITHADSEKPWLQTGPGREDGFFISHRSLARFITKSEGYNGQPIRLIGCNAGQCPYGLARNLSNKLGVEVLAPTGKAYIESNGEFWIEGVWRQFFPGAW